MKKENKMANAIKKVKDQIEIDICNIKTQDVIDIATNNAIVGAGIIAKGVENQSTWPEELAVVSSAGLLFFTTLGAYGVAKLVKEKNIAKTNNEQDNNLRDFDNYLDDCEEKFLDYDEEKSYSKVDNETENDLEM